VYVRVAEHQKNRMSAERRQEMVDGARRRGQRQTAGVMKKRRVVVDRYEGRGGCGTHLIFRIHIAAKWAIYSACGVYRRRMGRESGRDGHEVRRQESVQTKWVGLDWTKGGRTRVRYQDERNWKYSARGVYRKRTSRETRAPVEGARAAQTSVMG
jgi:hypothetical protein